MFLYVAYNDLSEMVGYISANRFDGAKNWCAKY